MEIDIPDLQDLTFVELCHTCGGSKQGFGHTNECYLCHGIGKRLTPVGDRLIKFLQAIGVPVTNHGGWVNIDV